MISAICLSIKVLTGPYDGNKLTLPKISLSVHLLIEFIFLSLKMKIVLQNDCSYFS